MGLFKKLSRGLISTGKSAPKGKVGSARLCDRRHSRPARSARSPARADRGRHRRAARPGAISSSSSATSIDRGPESAQVVERLRSYRPAFARADLPRRQSRGSAASHARRRDRRSCRAGSSLAASNALGATASSRRRLQRMDEEAALQLIAAKVPRAHRRVPRQLRRHLPLRRLSVRPCRHPAGNRDRRAGSARSAVDPRAVPERRQGAWTSSSFTATRSSSQVEERPNRIAIDTGAYHSGVLTALAVEDRERWYPDVPKASRTGLAGGMNGPSRPPPDLRQATVLQSIFSCGPSSAS